MVYIKYTLYQMYIHEMYINKYQMHLIYVKYISNVNINNANWYTYAARVAVFYICWLLSMPPVGFGSRAGNIKPQPEVVLTE